MDVSAASPAVFRRPRRAPIPLARPAVLFVRGAPRSGTTLVATMINASPDAAVIYEYAIDAIARDLRVLLAYEQQTTQRWELAPLGFALTDGQRAGAYFNDYGDPPNLHYPTDERFGHIVAAVVEAAVGKRDVRLVGSKTPGSVLASEHQTLDPYFADIRYLFMIRNPLDTINSMLNRRNLARLGADEWEIADIDVAISEYRRSVLSLLSHAAAYPDACYIVSFEDLFDRTVDTIAGLARFLDIDLGAAAGLVRRENGTKCVLTFDERSRVEAAFGVAIDSWAAKELTGSAVRGAAALHDCVENIVLGKRYRYVAAGGERHFLGMAWHPLEDAGVWSSRSESDLFFRVENGGEYVFSIELSCYLVGDQTSKSVGVELDGAVLFRGLAIQAESEILDGTDSDEVRVFDAPGPRTIVCGPVTLEAGHVNRLVLRTDDARSPQQFGVSADPRPLGIYLNSLVLNADRRRRGDR